MWVTYANQKMQILFCNLRSRWLFMGNSQTPIGITFALALALSFARARAHSYDVDVAF